MAQPSATSGRGSGAKANNDGKGKRQLDKELDKALEDSFPASDPPTPSQPTGTEPAGDPKTKP